MAYILLALLITTIVVGPAWWVRRVMKKYATPQSRYSGTGEALARHLLEQEGMLEVKVESTDEGADHYDPTDRAVRLSPSNFNSGSLTAIAVAAHEVGHAVQHHIGYQPLMLRTRIIASLDQLQRMGSGVLLLSPIIGIITRSPTPTLLIALVAFTMLGSGIVGHLVTLPTEIDASFRRALPLLKKHDILIDGDEPHARRILRAAAWTYAAAALISLFNVARWWAILRR